MQASHRLVPCILIIGSVPSCQNVRGQGRDLAYEDVVLRVGQAPAAVAIRDLDADHHLDLIVANEGSNDLSVMKGHGAGRFTLLNRVAAGDHPTHVDVADMDGSGTLDIVVANHEMDYLTILLGDGSGGFRPGDRSPLRIEVDPHPHVVKLVDFDADGRVDILVDDRGGRGIRFLRGDGRGGFDTPGVVIDVGDDPYRGMVVGDLNGDGRLDIVTPNRRTAAVVLARSDGGFGIATTLAAPNPFAVELADLNQDGTLDLVVASESGPTLIFSNDGRGGFAEMDPSWPMPNGGKWITVGDFNGDEVDDVAIVSFMSSEVTVLLGGPTIRATSFSSGENPWGMASADLNGDGRDDLVIGDNANDLVHLHLSRTP